MEQVGNVINTMVGIVSKLPDKKSHLKDLTESVKQAEADVEGDEETLLVEGALLDKVCQEVASILQSTDEEVVKIEGVTMVASDEGKFVGPAAPTSNDPNIAERLAKAKRDVLEALERKGKSIDHHTTYSVKELAKMTANLVGHMTTASFIGAKVTPSTHPSPSNRAARARLASGSRARHRVRAAEGEPQLLPGKDRGSRPLP